MVGADGGGVVRRGERINRFILSMEKTAGGAARGSATTIDAEIGSSGIRFDEANLSVCADCRATAFGEFR